MYIKKNQAKSYGPVLTWIRQRRRRIAYLSYRKINLATLKTISSNVIFQNKIRKSATLIDVNYKKE